MILDRFKIKQTHTFHHFELEQKKNNRSCLKIKFTQEIKMKRLHLELDLKLKKKK